MKARRLRILLLAAVVASLLCSTAFASGGTGDVASVIQSTWTAAADVSSVIQDTWKSAAGQIKTVVNNVVFPALDLILAVAFFGKVCMSYFDYRKHGQFEWAGPAILFACLVLALTAPLYIWTILGL